MAEDHDRLMRTAGSRILPAIDQLTSNARTYSPRAGMSFLLMPSGTVRAWRNW